jgi:N-acetylglucosaminyl-diphospho-decaprenol L-rhamnosyltransferase
MARGVELRAIFLRFGFVSLRTMTIFINPLSYQFATVIVSFNSGAYLLRAVQSVLLADIGDKAICSEIIIVDNGSSDDSLAAIEVLVPKVTQARIRILRNDKNLGFANAANRGWRASSAPVVLFLNPDCEIASGLSIRGALERAIDARVGVSSVALTNEDDSIQAPSFRKHPTPWRAIAQASGLSRLVPAWGVNMPPSRWGESEACSGAFMLMRRDVLERLQGFDEGYFLHCEDLDLCRRVTQAGLRVYISSQERVLHTKGTSSVAVPELVARAKFEGMRRYFEKFDAAATPRWLTALLMWGLRRQLHKALSAAKPTAK